MNWLNVGIFFFLAACMGIFSVILARLGLDSRQMYFKSKLVDLVCFVFSGVCMIFAVAIIIFAISS